MRCLEGCDVNRTQRVNSELGLKKKWRRKICLKMWMPELCVCQGPISINSILIRIIRLLYLIRHFSTLWFRPNLGLRHLFIRPGRSLTRTRTGWMSRFGSGWISRVGGGGWRWMGWGGWRGEDCLFYRKLLFFFYQNILKFFLFYFISNITYICMWNTTIMFPWRTNIKFITQCFLSISEWVLCYYTF